MYNVVQPMNIVCFVFAILLSLVNFFQTLDFIVKSLFVCFKL